MKTAAEMNKEGEQLFASMIQYKLESNILIETCDDKFEYDSLEAFNYTLANKNHITEKITIQITEDMLDINKKTKDLNEMMIDRLRIHAENVYLKLRNKSFNKLTIHHSEWKSDYRDNIIYKLVAIDIENEGE